MQYARLLAAAAVAALFAGEAAAQSVGIGTGPGFTHQQDRHGHRQDHR